MMRISIGAAAFLCLAAAGAVAWAEEAPPPVAVSYFERLDAIYRTGSTPDDIARLFELMTDDVRYVHRDYGADFDRAAWEAAFARLHGEGRYSAPAEFCTFITNSIAGKMHHAIEYIEGAIKDGACTPTQDPRKLVLFEIEDEQISRIDELW
jgi:hypothetical protein